MKHLRVQISLSTSVFMLPPWVQCTVALKYSMQYSRSCALNQMNKKDLKLDYRVETFFRLLGSLALWKAGIIVICSHFVIIRLSLPLSLDCKSKEAPSFHFTGQYFTVSAYAVKFWWQWCNYGQKHLLPCRNVILSAFENLLYFCKTGRKLRVNERLYEINSEPAHDNLD